LYLNTTGMHQEYRRACRMSICFQGLTSCMTVFGKACEAQLFKVRVDASC
jgi:hypothetical protein